MSFLLLEPILLSNPLKTFSLPLRSLIASLKVSALFSSLPGAFGFLASLNLSVSYFMFMSALSVSFSVSIPL